MMNVCVMRKISHLKNTSENDTEKDMLCQLEFTYEKYTLLDIFWTLWLVKFFGNVYKYTIERVKISMKHQNSIVMENESDSFQCSL